MVEQENPTREQPMIHPSCCGERNALLKPWAVHCTGEVVHKYPAGHPGQRTFFQQDRDRMLHSEAFRRLGYKTQVFVVHEGDFYRTRLTHTLEVSQVARGIAGALGANEDLCETVAYAHDIGHPPFGHRGEAALDELLSGALEAKFGLVKPIGGKAFEQNFQSFRIVDSLEKRYPGFPGLNLSWHALHAILKHHTAFDKPVLPYHLGAWAHGEAETIKSRFLDTPGCSAEAQIVNLADQIAWVTHDLEDALRVRFLTVEELRDLNNPLLQQAWARAEEGAPDWNKDRILWGRLIVRNMINLLINDVLSISRDKAARMVNVEAVIGRPEPVVDFSAEMAASVEGMRKFLIERVYTHPVVERMSVKAAGILERLFESLTHDLLDQESQSARLLPRVTRKRLEAQVNPVAKYQVVVDFLAGMTDRFATEFYRILYAPDERGITSLY